ncbi:6-phosphogluconolactonase-like [Oopsacas minuta]|uniref:6-phosphogluconolactonase n=1 Tax=Oopsacas minuta TaxID=111878 RepID=A0AAV7JM88_9METZ|nr:6-phosphogluconolactonase-like [Oopsacas minuta]
MAEVKGSIEVIVLKQDKLQEELSSHLDKLVLQSATEAIQARGVFTIGLSGGSLIKALSEVLKVKSADIKWDNWRVFFCDERHVPLDDEASTYGEYKKALFDHVPLPDKNIFRIDPTTELEVAAKGYRDKLESVFGKNLPEFDLLLLGMGPDGHTCSLFPQHQGLDESKEWIIPITNSPKPPPNRITMTYPVLNNSKHTAIVTTGSSKADALKRCIKPDKPDDVLPAGLVKAKLVSWLVDEAAYSACK